MQEFALVVTVRVGRYAVHHFTDCMEINRNEAEPTSTQLSAFHFCAAFVRLTIINKSFVVFFTFCVKRPQVLGSLYSALAACVHELFGIFMLYDLCERCKYERGDGEDESDLILNRADMI